MNWKRILKILGFIMLVTGAFMILPMIVAFIYHEKDWVYFLITIAGLPDEFYNQLFYAVTGFAAVI